MRVLITGASGFIGPHLVRELATCGHSGTAVSRREVRQLPRDWNWRPRDVILASNSGGAARWDCIVHLEVKQHVPVPCQKDLVEFRQVNVEGTREWLQFAAHHGIQRFVYVSSIKAVNARSDGETTETATGPNSTPYGTSKWEAEQLATEWAHREGRSAIIVRPAVVYGPGNVGNVGAMVQAIARGSFFLVGPNANVKSMISVRNVASAIRSLAERNTGESCAVYNLTDRESYTVRELDAMIRRRLGKSGNSPTLPLALAWAAARMGDLTMHVPGLRLPLNSNRLNSLMENSRFTCAKLAGTGFEHPEAAEDGIAAMVASYRQTGGAPLGTEQP